MFGLFMGPRKIEAIYSDNSAEIEGVAKVIGAISGEAVPISFLSVRGMDQHGSSRPSCRTRCGAHTKEGC